LKIYSKHENVVDLILRNKAFNTTELVAAETFDIYKIKIKKWNLMQLYLYVENEGNEPRSGKIDIGSELRGKGAREREGKMRSEMIPLIEHPYGIEKNWNTNECLKEIEKFEEEC